MDDSIIDSKPVLSKSEKSRSENNSKNTQDVEISNKIPEIQSKPSKKLEDNSLKILFGAFSKLKNAETLYQAGASILIEEKDLNSNKLYKNINYLINNKNILEKMSLAAKALSKPNATKKITNHVIDMVSNV